MTTIPDDIMKTVGDILGPPGERVASDKYKMLCLRMGMALAAERERCAKVAEHNIDYNIAKAIRSGAHHDQ